MEGKMKKTYLFCIIVVILIGGIGFLGVNYFKLLQKGTTTSANNVKKNNNAIFATNDNERIIEYDKMIDLDMDGVLERVVLDNQKDGEFSYTRLLIYQVKDEKEKLLFDSIKAGVTDFCGQSINKNELIEIADDDHNGMPEIYLQEWGFASDPCRVAIVEKTNHQYQVLFFDHLDDLAYKDFDNDGIFELYGCTMLGEGILFGAAEYSVFKRKDGVYCFSTELSQIYNLELCAKAEETFNSDSNFGNLENLICRYARAGQKEKGIAVIKKNFSLLYSADFPEKDKNFYIDYFNSKLESYRRTR